MWSGRTSFGGKESEGTKSVTSLVTLLVRESNLRSVLLGWRTAGG